MAEQEQDKGKATTDKPKPYTKDEQAQAARKMFDELAKLRGGKLILGCCTQGCCA